eukprot:1186195-Prorocentrum_minimum.AAC.10
MHGGDGPAACVCVCVRARSPGAAAVPGDQAGVVRHGRAPRDREGRDQVFASVPRALLLRAEDLQPAVHGDEPAHPRPLAHAAPQDGGLLPRQLPLPHLPGATSVGERVL